MKKDIKKIVALIIVLFLLLSLFSQYIVSSAQNEMQIFLDFNSLFDSKNSWNFANEYGFSPPVFQNGIVYSSGAMIGETKDLFQNDILRIKVKFNATAPNQHFVMGLRSVPKTFTIKDDMGQKILYDPWNANVYDFTVTNVGLLSLYKNKETDTTILGTANTSLADGNEHTLQFSAINNELNTSVDLSVIIDGVEVLSYTDVNSPYLNSGKLFVKSIGELTLSVADTSVAWPIEEPYTGPIVDETKYINFYKEFSKAKNWVVVDKNLGMPTIESNKFSVPSTGATANWTCMATSKNSYKNERLRLRMTFFSTDANDMMTIGLRAKGTAIEYFNYKGYDPWNSDSMYYINVMANGSITLNKCISDGSHGFIRSILASCNYIMPDNKELILEFSAINQTDGSVTLKLINNGTELISCNDNTKPIINEGNIYFKGNAVVMDATDTSTDWPIEQPYTGPFIDETKYINLFKEFLGPKKWNTVLTAPLIENGKMQCKPTDPAAPQYGWEFISISKNTYTNEILRFKHRFFDTDKGLTTISLRTTGENEEYFANKSYNIWSANTAYYIIFDGSNKRVALYKNINKTQIMLATYDFDVYDNQFREYQFAASNQSDGSVFISLMLDGNTIISKFDFDTPIITGGNIYIRGKCMELEATEINNLWQPEMPLESRPLVYEGLSIKSSNPNIIVNRGIISLSEDMTVLDFMNMIAVDDGRATFKITDEAGADVSDGFVSALDKNLLVYANNLLIERYTIKSFADDFITTLGKNDKYIPNEIIPNEIIPNEIIPNEGITNVDPSSTNNAPKKIIRRKVVTTIYTNVPTNNSWIILVIVGILVAGIGGAFVVLIIKKRKNNGKAKEKNVETI